MDSSKNVIFLIDSECLPYDTDEVCFAKNVKTLRLSVLKILTYLSSDIRFNDFRWSYKLFSSFSDYSTSIVKERAKLEDFTLEAFEEFEEIVSVKLERLRKFIVLQNDNEPSSIENDPSRPGVKRSSNHQLKSYFVQKALKELLHEFDWNVPQIMSPVKLTRWSSKQRIGQCQEFDKCNYVFYFGKCPTTFEEIEAYCGAKIKGGNSHPLLNSIMPSALLSQFAESLKINLYWIDSNWIFTKQECIQSTYGLINQALKSVNGKIIPINQIVWKSLDRCCILPLLGDGKQSNVDGLVSFSKEMDYYFENRKENVNSVIKKTETSLTTLNFLNNEHAMKIKMSIISHFQNRAKSNIKLHRDLYIVCAINRNINVCSLKRGDSYICYPAEDKTLFQDLTEYLFEKNLALLVSNPATKSVLSGIFLPVSRSILHYISFQSQIKGSSERLCETIQNSDNMASFMNKFLKSCTVNRCKNSSEKVSGSASLFSTKVFENWYAPSNKLQHKRNNFCRIKVKREKLFLKLDNSLREPSRIYKKANSASKKKEDQIVRLFKSDSGNLRMTRSRPSVNNSKSDVKSVPETRSKTRTSVQGDFSNKIQESEDEVIFNLKKSYQSTLDGGFCLLSCAQNSLTVLGHLTNNDCQKVEKLLKEGLILSSAEISAKHENDPSSEQKIKEYQLQVLLMLEYELLKQIEEATFCDNIVLLLRNMSFLTGPSALSTFLSEAIFTNYMPNLQQLLFEICEELNQPLPPGFEVQDSSSSDNDELDSNISSIKSENFPSIASSASSSSAANAAMNIVNIRKRNLRHKSFGDNSLKRQIVITKQSNDKKKSKEKGKKTAVRRNLFNNGSPVKLKRRNTTNCVLTSPSRTSYTSKKENTPKKNNVLDESSMLTSPKTPKRAKSNLIRKTATTPKGRHVLKTTFVPETPEHKEGRFGVFRRQQNLRRRTISSMMVETVEESPDKTTKSCYVALSHSNSVVEYSPMKKTRNNSHPRPLFKTPSKSPRHKSTVKSLFNTPSKSMKDNILDSDDFPAVNSDKTNVCKNSNSGEMLSTPSKIKGIINVEGSDSNCIGVTPSKTRKNLSVSFCRLNRSSSSSRNLTPISGSSPSRSPYRSLRSVGTPSKSVKTLNFSSENQTASNEDTLDCDKLKDLNSKLVSSSSDLTLTHGFSPSRSPYRSLRSFGTPSKSVKTLNFSSENQTTSNEGTLDCDKLKDLNSKSVSSKNLIPTRLFSPSRSPHRSLRSIGTPSISVKTLIFSNENQPTLNEDTLGYDKCKDLNSKSVSSKNLTPTRLLSPSRNPYRSLRSVGTPSKSVKTLNFSSENQTASKEGTLDCDKLKDFNPKSVSSSRNLMPTQDFSPSKSPYRSLRSVVTPSKSSKTLNFPSENQTTSNENTLVSSKRFIPTQLFSPSRSPYRSLRPVGTPSKSLKTFKFSSENQTTSSEATLDCDKLKDLYSSSVMPSQNLTHTELFSSSQSPYKVHRPIGTPSKFVADFNLGVSSEIDTTFNEDSTEFGKPKLLNTSPTRVSPPKNKESSKLLSKEDTSIEDDDIQLSVKVVLTRLENSVQNVSLSSPSTKQMLRNPRSNFESNDGSPLKSAIKESFLDDSVFLSETCDADSGNMDLNSQHKCANPGQELTTAERNVNFDVLPSKIEDKELAVRLNKSPETSLRDWRRIKPRFGKVNSFKSLSPSSKLYQVECAPQRLTRNATQSIGLSPETVRNLSILSPIVPTNKRKQMEDDLVDSLTPENNSAKKPTYVSPSALSLVHLTSSPMILRSHSPKKLICRKKLIDDS